MTNTPSPALASFEKMLAGGKEGALLRFSLGNEYLKVERFDVAVEHLQRAVALDPDFTAAWKALGRALAASGRPDDALSAYRAGMIVAQRKGDKQAGREMEVFARRIEKARGEPS